MAMIWLTTDYPDGYWDGPGAQTPLAIKAAAQRQATCEMYHALKAITDCYGVGYKSADQFVKDVHDFMMEGRAALAKARGETCATPDRREP